MPPFGSQTPFGPSKSQAQRGLYQQFGQPQSTTMAAPPNQYQYQAGPPDAAYQAKAAKDQAAFGALGALGVAGQNAMGQYGMGRQQALVNSQIAQTNALNSMANMHYNTVGQGMSINAGLGAAGLQAGSDYAKAQMAGALGAGMINAGMYGAQMGPYTAGNLNLPNINFGGFGGGGGFGVSGPEGGIASGNYGGAQALTPPPPRPGGQGGFNPPPSPPYVGGRQGGRQVDPFKTFQSSQNLMGEMYRGLTNPNSMPYLARNDMRNAFQQTQANLMNPGIMNSLNSQLSQGYGLLGGLYRS